MKSEQKYNALVKINNMLLEFAATQPNEHFKLHGGKDINEAIQLCKQLITQTSTELQMEELDKVEMYLDGGSSLSLHNIGGE